MQVLVILIPDPLTKSRKGEKKRKWDMASEHSGLRVVTGVTDPVLDTLSVEKKKKMTPGISDPLMGWSYEIG